MTSSNPLSDDVAIRPYRSGDERQLVDLFRRAFGVDISEDHWRWKLKACSGAVENVWLAECAEKPIFQYAGIPACFQVARAPVAAMISVDTMTAPEFRRRGLLTRVATEAYAAWRDANTGFVLGLPNQQWGSRTQALGWRPLFPLQWLVRPLRPESLVARRSRIGWLKTLTLPATLWNQHLQRQLAVDRTVSISAVSSAGAEFDDLWKTCGKDWEILQTRNAAWVQWRFRDAPARRYDIMLGRRAGRAEGYAAYRMSRTRRATRAAAEAATGVAGSAYLAEIFASRDDDWMRDALLHDVIDSLLAEQAEAVYTLAVPGTRLFDWLRRAGFYPRASFSVQWIPLQPDLGAEAVTDPARWFLTGADFDVI